MDPERPQTPPPALPPPLPPPGIQVNEAGCVSMELLVRSITPIATLSDLGEVWGDIHLQPPPPILAIESATDTDGDKDESPKESRSPRLNMNKSLHKTPQHIDVAPQGDEELGGGQPLPLIPSFVPDRKGPIGWKASFSAEMENYTPGLALAFGAGLASLASALFMLDPSDDNAGLGEMLVSRLVAFFIWVSPPLHFGVVQLLRLWMGSYQLGVVFLTIFWDIFVLIYNLLTAFGLPGNYVLILISVFGSGMIYFHSFTNFSEEHPEGANIDTSRKLNWRKAISVGYKLLLAQLAISCAIMLITKLVWAGELSPLQVLILTVGVLPGLCNFFAALSYYFLRDLHKAGCQNLWTMEAWIMSTVVLLLRTLSTDRQNSSLLIGFVILSGLREVLLGLGFRWKTQLWYMVIKRKFRVKQLTAIDRDEILRQMHKQWYERGRGSVQKVRDVMEVAGTIAYGIMVAMREKFGGATWGEACGLAAWLIIMQLVVGFIVDVTLTHYLSKWWGLRPLRLKAKPFPLALWLLVGGNLMCQAVFNHGIWYGPNRPSLL